MGCGPEEWGGADTVAGPSPLRLCSQKLLRSPRKPTRKISKIPFKVLDAPELQDDFYLNLVDWSSLNVLSVGLGTCVYLWSACTSQVGARGNLGGLSLPDPCQGTRLCGPQGGVLRLRDQQGAQSVILTSCPQVTRLCDLSVEGDSVTSVGWSERVRAGGSCPRGPGLESWWSCGATQALGSLPGPFLQPHTASAAQRGSPRTAWSSCPLEGWWGEEGWTPGPGV